MKLVDILARELEEWADNETHAAVVDEDGGYVIQFTTGGAPIWNGRSYTILGDGCGPDVYWRNEDPIDAQGLASAPENMCSREDWQAARAAYLASVQPERDAPAQPEYTGGSVSYYTVHIANPTTEGREPYDAECNDIIEALGMDYAEGNVFKAIWRRAAARQGLAKRGYTDGLYDAEKIVFFGKRLVELEKSK